MIILKSMIYETFLYIFLNLLIEGLIIPIIDAI